MFIFLSSEKSKTLSTLFHFDFLFICIGCPSDYWAFGDSCYQIVKDAATNRNDAAAACGSQGHLVNIATEEEQTYLAGILKASDSNDVWIGFSQMTWSDDSELGYTAWYDPNGGSVPAECVHMTRAYNYQWGSGGCEDLKGFVCEFEGRCYLDCFHSQSSKSTHGPPEGAPIRGLMHNQF